MKKIIVLLAIVGLLIPGFALAESVHVYGEGDTKLIVTRDNEGYIKTYRSHKVGDGMYLMYDNQGNSTRVFDFSTDPEPEKESGFFDTPDLLD